MGQYNIPTDDLLDEVEKISLKNDTYFTETDNILFTTKLMKPLIRFNV